MSVPRYNRCKLSIERYPVNLLSYLNNYIKLENVQNRIFLMEVKEPIEIRYSAEAVDDIVKKYSSNSDLIFTIFRDGLTEDKANELSLKANEIRSTTISIISELASPCCVAAISHNDAEYDYYNETVKDLMYQNIGLRDIKTELMPIPYRAILDLLNENNHIGFRTARQLSTYIYDHGTIAVRSIFRNYDDYVLTIKFLNDISLIDNYKYYIGLNMLNFEPKYYGRMINIDEITKICKEPKEADVESLPLNGSIIKSIKENTNVQSVEDLALFVTQDGWEAKLSNVGKMGQQQILNLICILALGCWKL